MGDILSFRKNSESTPQPNPELQIPVQEMLSLNNAALIEVEQSLAYSMPDVLAETAPARQDEYELAA